MAAIGVPFLPIRERFEQERRACVELFAPDGHCNDAGYALLAEVVADAVAPRLAR